MSKIRRKFPASSLDITNSLDSLYKDSIVKDRRLLESQNFLQPSILRSLPASRPFTRQRAQRRNPKIPKAGEFLKLSPTLEKLIDNYTIHDVKDFVNFHLMEKMKIGSNPISIYIDNITEQIDQLDREYQETELNQKFLLLEKKTGVEESRSAEEIFQEQIKLIKEKKRALESKQIWENLIRELGPNVSFQEATKIFENILKSPEVISVSTQNKSLKNQLIAEKGAFGLVYESDYFKNPENQLVVSPFALYSPIDDVTKGSYAINPTLGAISNYLNLHLEVLETTIENVQEDLKKLRKEKDLHWFNESRDEEANNLRTYLGENLVEKMECEAINDYLEVFLESSRFLTQVAYLEVKAINIKDAPSNELFLK